MPPPSASRPLARPSGADEEVLALIARQVTTVPWGVALGAQVVLLTAWSSAPRSALLAWAVAVLGLQAWRMHRLRRLPAETDRPLDQRVRTAVWLSGLNGLVHGAAVGLFPWMDEAQRAILTILLGGLSVAAVGTTHGHPRIYRAFTLPAMGALIAGWAALGLTGPALDWGHLGMALLLVAYLAVMLGLARDADRRLCDATALREEQERLNGALRQALDEARVAMAARNRFLASASHDLRQPLQTLTLLCAALETRVQTADSRDIVHRMDLALDSLREEMNALLDLSRLDAGVVELHRAPLSLDTLLGRLGEELQSACEAKGLRARCVIEPGLVCESDAVHLERLLRNLIDNAVKYTEEGEVQLRALRTGEQIEVVVQDTGVGMAASDQERVFEEFFQVHNPARDRSKGLGLGLSIVRRLARLLDHPLSLRSAPGEGSTFTLWLPVATRAPEPAASAQPAAVLPRCHLLVLDDEAGVREALATLMRSLGCEVSEAASTAEALKAQAARAPDLVLADFRLAGRDSGLRAIAALRKRQPTLPALLVSGDTAEDRLRQARDAGVPLLHKPVSVSRLLEAMAEALGEPPNPT